MTSYSITVQWEAVNCIHRNGDITSYLVLYGVVGSGSSQTVSVSGTEVTIPDLMASTNYAIQVTAVTIDFGPYNSAVYHLTAGIIVIY